MSECEHESLAGDGWCDLCGEAIRAEDACPHNDYPAILAANQKDQA